ncbi:MAG: G-D-S-L family lipolytic [Bacteroidetes bacterium]|nr:MAG: G-D-S-L family lipolytic [Bacteroidota bacterium]
MLPNSTFKKAIFVAMISSIILISFSFMQKKPVRIVLFGDSITQMGNDPGGYIDLMRQAIAGKDLSDRYELIGEGIGGNKVYDLYLRLEDDVLAHNPDVVFIYIGVNDVWHKAWGTGTDADKFEGFYRALIRKIQATGAKVVLCTPAVIGERTDFTNQLDGDLNKYSVTIRNLAAEFNCSLIDLRRAFLDYNLKNNPENLEKGILTTDGVHLNEKGNRMVADAFLSEIFPK